MKVDKSKNTKPSLAAKLGATLLARTNRLGPLITENVSVAIASTNSRSNTDCH